MSSDDTYGSPSGRHPTTIEYAENAKIAGVAGKKVFVVDSAGNQVNWSYSSWITTAVTLTDANTVYKLPTTEQVGRRIILIYNISDTAIYIGASDVTTSTGFLISAGSTLTLNASSGIYAVCGSAGKIINLLEGK